MNSETSTLKRLMTKYKFLNDIPGDVKQHIYTNKNMALKKSLKQLGEYSLPYAVLLNTYLLFRKGGFRVSMLFCKLFLTGIIITVSGTSSVVLYQYFSEKPVGHITENTFIEKPDIIKNKATTLQKQFNIQTGIKLAITGIESSVNNSDQCRQIPAKLYKILSHEYRPGEIVLDEINTEVKPMNILTGRMYTIGEKNLLTIKIIDTEKRTVRFIRTISFKKDESIDPVLDEISATIIKMDFMKN